MTIKDKVSKLRCQNNHCASPEREHDESDICPDGYCRECHKSLSFESCVDGSWVDEQRRAAGLPRMPR
jgi:hypothetical protein